MEKQKLSSIMFLVSGILVLLNAAFLYYIIYAVENAAQHHQLVLNSTEATLLRNEGTIVFILPTIGIFSSIVLLLSSYMINKGKNVKMWAVAGIVFSLLSILGNGGFIVGFLIGIIAGVLALVK